MLTLMVFKMVLCLSSSNYPSGFCCFVFDENQLNVIHVCNYKNGLRINPLHNSGYSTLF